MHRIKLINIGLVKTGLLNFWYKYHSVVYESMVSGGTQKKLLKKVELRSSIDKEIIEMSCMHLQ
jgi:hypothetical protein